MHETPWKAFRVHFVRHQRLWNSNKRQMLEKEKKKSKSLYSMNFSERTLEGCFNSKCEGKLAEEKANASKSLEKSYSTPHMYHKKIISCPNK